MELANFPEVFEGLVNQLIDEETLGVCFELHRAIKLGYYDLLYPDDSVYEKHDLVEVKGLDIFGNSPMCVKKPVDCECPNCSRTLGAQKFAPHLEKCMGMGRNSSRLANKKSKNPVGSEAEGSDDNEEEWTYPEKRAKKMKKERQMTSSPRRGNGKSSRNGKELKEEKSSGGQPMTENFYHLKPSMQQHNVTSFTGLPLEYKHTLLQQICGVVSERTSRLCTRSINCPQHSEEQRLEVRKQLLSYDQQPVELLSSNLSPHVKRSKSNERERDKETEGGEMGFLGVSESHHPVDMSAASSQDEPPPRPDEYDPSSSSVAKPPRKKKLKLGRKSKKSGHPPPVSSVTATTIPGPPY